MFRVVAILAFALAINFGAVKAWSQVVGSGAPTTNNPGNPSASSPGGVVGGANPATAGTPDNPNLEATDVNQLDARARDTDLATDPINDPQPVGTTQPTMQSMTTATQQASRSNDWRLVSHHGVWWYWTPDNTWLYYRNDQWNAYLPGDIRRQQALRNHWKSRERYGVGYRGGAAYDANENPSGQAYPNQGRAGVGSGTNYSGSVFYEQRPILPNAVELQRFQQMQRANVTPYGGTSGGVQDPNLSGSNPVVGGNPIRGGVATPGGTYSNGGVGTSATGGGAASPNPSSGVTGPSPNPSSGVSPSSTSTPGNPSAGSTPAGGATGAGGTGTSGAASGAGGTGS